MPFAVASKASSQSSSVTSSIGPVRSLRRRECTTRSRRPSSSRARATSVRAPSGPRRSPSAGPPRRRRSRLPRAGAAIARPTRPVPPATSARLSVLCKGMLDRSKTGARPGGGPPMGDDHVPIVDRQETHHAQAHRGARCSSRSRSRDRRALPRRTVNIYASGFSPKTVTIVQGDTITWINRDTANHQILADKGQFVSPILGTGRDFSLHVQRRRHLHVQGRAASEDHRHDRRQGLRRPDAHARRLDRDHLSATKATLSGVVSNHQPNER